jgi:hypothetical protein
MKILKAAVAMLLLFVFAAMFANPARADRWDKKTVMTFNRTVEMPGLVLPAGTYTFKVDSTARNVVRVYNKDESMLLTTILAIGDHRLKATEKTAVQFREQPSGARPEISAWFYPGETDGREFVYPK